MKPVVIHKVGLTGVLLWVSIGALPLSAFRHEAGAVLFFEALLLVLLLKKIISCEKLVIPRGVFVLLPLVLVSGLASLQGWGGVVPVELPVLVSLLAMPVLLWSFFRALPPAEFHSVIMVAGLAAVALGLYEYAHFLLYGPTSTPLIPFLLPASSGQRLVGPFGQPNLFALFLNIVLLSTVYRAVHPVDVGQRRVLFCISFLPVILTTFVLVQTGSRAGALALSLVLLMLSFLVARGYYLQQDSSARTRFILCLGVILSTSLLSWVAGSAGMDRWAMDGQAGVAGISTDVRFVFWLTAWLMFKDNIIFGAGLGQYELLMAKYGVAAHDLLGFVSYESIVRASWAHNDFLQILAEGGVLAGLAVFVLALYLYRLFRRSRSEIEVISNAHLYLFGMLLIFIVQAMFSYPLHDFSMLAIFFFILTAIFILDRDYTFSLGRWGRTGLVLVFMLGSFSLASYSMKEYRLGTFKHDLMSGAPLEQTFPQFVALTQGDYGTHLILSRALPFYLNRALASNSSEFAAVLIPYAVKLVQLEGAGSQWYNLALLQALVGNHSEARLAVNKALELRPLDTRLWSLLHYLDMHKASRATGRPIESFYPHGKAYRLNGLGG